MATVIDKYKHFTLPKCGFVAINNHVTLNANLQSGGELNCPCA